MIRYRMRVLHVAWLSVATAMGCSGDGPQLPHITPPVRAAIPPGLGGTAQGVAPLLNASDIYTRFFTPGPTGIYSILETIDGRIDEINQRTGDCLTQEPVAYTVEAWGQSLTAYAQCTRDLDAPSGSPTAFIEFGTAPDGAIWINDSQSGGTTLAQLTPIADATGQYAVHIWLALPDPANPLDCTNPPPVGRGSYGAVELKADESTNAFEMVVAGTGFGYCGAQLKSDGTSVYFTGSIDMGSTCNAIDSICGAASDVVMPATCGSSTTSFALPALGRMAVPSCNIGASQYPASGNTVDVSGAATDTVQTFATTAPAPGVGSI
jgi:hypothetical protein